MPGDLMNQIKAVLCLVMLIALWPLCAAVWLIQWPFVRFLDRAPKGHAESLARRGSPSMDGIAGPRRQPIAGRSRRRA